MALAFKHQAERPIARNQTRAELAAGVLAIELDPDRRMTEQLVCPVAADDRPAALILAPLAVELRRIEAVDMNDENDLDRIAVERAGGFDGGPGQTAAERELAVDRAEPEPGGEREGEQ